MDIPLLIIARTEREADARLRRRRQLEAAAEVRAVSRERADAERIVGLQSQIEKWKSSGISSANLHVLEPPVVRPHGTFPVFPEMDNFPPPLGKPSSSLNGDI